MAEKFKKNKEDFTCENCEVFIKGNGYTNHCTNCLWSKHVDVFPGDRAEECGALMEPVRAEKKHGEWTLFHKCLMCHEIKKSRLNPKDNFDEVIKISNQ